MALSLSPSTPLLHHSGLPFLHVEKHGLVVALQANIETVNGFAVPLIASCNQSFAPRFVLN
jgi:hypothetical protein